MLQLRDTNAPWLKNVLHSFDEGVSWTFVGHLHDGNKFVGQPNMLKLDEVDRAEVISEIEAEYPDANVALVKVPPVGYTGERHDDDPPPDEPPPPSPLIIP